MNYKRIIYYSYTKSIRFKTQKERSDLYNYSHASIAAEVIINHWLADADKMIRIR